MENYSRKENHHKNKDNNDSWKLLEGENDGSSRIHVKLVKGDDPDDDFTPLAPPAKLEVFLKHISGDLIEQLDSNVHAELAEGLYELPLGPSGGGEPFMIEIPANCICSISVAAGKDAFDTPPGTPAHAIEGARSKTLVTSLNIGFSKSLILPNILTVLGRLPRLFRDHRVRAVKKGMTTIVHGRTAENIERIGKNWVKMLQGTIDSVYPDADKVSQAIKGLFSSLSRSAGELGREFIGRKLVGRDFDEFTKDLEAWIKDFKQDPGNQPTIELDRIKARPAWWSGRWVLEISFSGKVIYGKSIVRRFRDIVLPRVILPAPHALLENLLGHSPLASAQMDVDKSFWEDLALKASPALKRIDGTFRIQGRSPIISLSFPTTNEGLLDLAAQLDESLTLEGDLAAGLQPGMVNLSVEQLTISDRKNRLSAKVEAVAKEKNGENTVKQLIKAAFDGSWPHDSLELETSIDVHPESRLTSLSVAAGSSHPLAKGRIALLFNASSLALGGHLVFRTGAEPQSLIWDRTEASFSTELSLAPGSVIDDGLICIKPVLEGGCLNGKLQNTPEGFIQIDLEGSAATELKMSAQIEDFPELDIEEGLLEVSARGKMDFTASANVATPKGAMLEMDVKSGIARIILERCGMELGRRTLRLPSPSGFSFSISEATMATTGLGQCKFQFSWDFGGESPLLSCKPTSNDGEILREIEIFVPELRQGDFTIDISQAGGVRILGREKGLYDAHFFNALVNPGAEPDKWLEILDNDEAMDKVLGTLCLFSQDARKFLEKTKEWARRVRKILKSEKIDEIKDVLPANRMALVIAKSIVELAEIMRAGATVKIGKSSGKSKKQQINNLTEKIHRIILQVVEGNGLDIPRVKRILSFHLPDHDFEFELDRILRISANLLAPTEPLAPMTAEPETPLADLSRYKEMFKRFPTAAEIYEKAESPDRLSCEFSEMISLIAPYLTLEGVTYLLKTRNDWDERHRRILKTVRELKKRTRMISEAYGGIAFAPQAWAISFFIGEATRKRYAKTDTGTPTGRPALKTGTYRLANGLLGPEETAVLLQSGLASFWQGRTAQINGRLLMDYIRRQPETFLAEVLVEMSSRSPRALTNILFALLQWDQTRLRETLHMENFLEKRLGIPMPRLDDHLAGGRFARESHYEAVARTAREIIRKAEPYLALKEVLQIHRHPVTLDAMEVIDEDSLAAKARRAVEEAENIALKCNFKGSRPRGVRKAKQAYKKAFAECAALMRHDSAAFHAKWFKEFWSRNYEALMVLSVVRNIQANIDKTPQWLERMTKRSNKKATGGFDPKSTRDSFEESRETFKNEQALIDRVIEALYHFEPDRRRLKADPLVRLSIDPPSGNYNFTIISCMGVITEGAKGLELKDAYSRLEEQRSIKVIRADTRTARSLEYNAARVEDALKTVHTPWGYIGYSQGCANGLQAESRLLGGTPAQQKLVGELRCRHLLFSAMNGSAHGTCGDMKFLRAMTEGDKFLKHYQAVLSRKAVESALKNIRLLLDSRLVVHTLGGAHSLSHVGVQPLARDGQFRYDVPTTTVRGIVEDEFLPEALEFLSNVLTKQIQSADHDTQVTTWEAVGHPVWVLSPMGRVLELCDIGSLVQRTHHWSPLLYTTEFITTDRDHERMVYHFPKDRHVFPWIEVNARFGNIETI